MVCEKRNVGRYWVFRPLASGGMATVHLGCLRSAAGVSRPVAIKELHPHVAREVDAIDRFLAEGRIASRIRHPNVVPVLDVVVEGDDRLLVMELIHGVSLSELLTLAARTGDLPSVDVAVRIVVDALEGLHAAHEATNEHGGPLMVVHRDVSPQNIMVEAEGRARIVDFGIAKAFERSFTTGSTGAIRGKLAYSAPEQIGGHAVDRRTDIWGAGMVLWELLAGKRHFLDAEPAEIVRRITAEPIPPPSSIRPCPPTLDAVVVRALDRDADMRFASAREMALALEKSGSIADHRTVARWVRRLAHARLDDTSRMVNEMEAELRREPPPEPTDTAANPVAAEARAEPGPRARGRRILVPAVIAVALATAGLGGAFVRARSSREGVPASSAGPEAKTGAVASASVAPPPTEMPVASARGPLPEPSLTNATKATKARTKTTAGVRSDSGSGLQVPPGPAAAPAPARVDPLDRDERQ